MAHNVELSDFLVFYITFILFLELFRFSAPILVIKKNFNEIVSV